MIYTAYYDSPLGRMLLAAKDEALIGLWIEGQKYYLGSLKDELVEGEDEGILVKTKFWLDEYFAGKRPAIKDLKLAPEGSDFAKIVWGILCEIPYGKTVTYGDIAREAAGEMGLKSMSAQAVGRAVGHNPITVIIPCHRVVGARGNLTGFAGGIDKKIMLLTHEGADMEGFYVPKRSSAP